MRTSLEWIRSMVPELSCTAQEYMDAMTLSGSKVEGYEELDADLEKIVIGQIEKIEKHPDADKLIICQVNVGTGENIQIVTGAPNVKEGDKVPVVLDGGRVAGGRRYDPPPAILQRADLCQIGRGLFQPPEKAAGLPEGSPAAFLRLCCSENPSFQHPQDGGLGLYAHGGIHQPPVLEDHQGGNAHHPEALGQLRLLVDVDLTDLDPAGLLLRDGVHRRGKHPAGRAPGRPEIHQHGGFGGQHLLLEIGVL